MNPKISIIIPCYNVERYVRECVESVLNQTLREIEIIIVNDGSTDGTGEILHEVANKDKRIILITQENGGYGVAVNNGIAKAKGEYIGIVESDDFINPQMYEKLYAKAKETDAQVVKCNF
ncbi:glycosyltransferase family 2 protein, partial [Helicobacter sp. T3_23-1059]